MLMRHIAPAIRPIPVRIFSAMLTGISATVLRTNTLRIEGSITALILSETVTRDGVRRLEKCDKHLTHWSRMPYSPTATSRAQTSQAGSEGSNKSKDALPTSSVVAAANQRPDPHLAPQCGGSHPFAKQCQRMGASI